MKKFVLIFAMILLFTTGCEEKNVIEKTNAGYTHISMDVAEEYMKEEDTIILDVRTEEEYKYGHIENAMHIPIDELRENLNKLPTDKKIYVYCHTGLRSYIATRILKGNGFDSVNIMGGFYFYNSTK